MQARWQRIASVMVSELRRLRLAVVLGLVACTTAGAWAQSKPPPKPAKPAPGTTTNIYTCTDAAGRTLTSDRPIAECASREQRVLAPDGSLRSIIGPTLSREEQAERDARIAREAREREAKQRELRRDRTLLARYPDRNTHDVARDDALASARSVIRSAEARIAQIATERKALEAEAEFYVGKPLPAKLAQQMEINDAAAEAQREVIGTQQAELDRLNRVYDAELQRLRGLWVRNASAQATPVPASGARSTP
jgi:hypothetical protein